MVSGILGGIAGGAVVAITIKAVDEFSNTFRSANAGLGLLKTGAVAAVAAAGALAGSLAALGVSSLKTAADFEQTEIAFATMLGSAERAQAFLEDVKKFAKETPFELNEVVIGAQRLMAMGVAAEDTLTELEKLGDISAGVGKDKLPALILAFGQVRAAGKLTGQELRQFTEAGVPLLEELAKLANEGRLAGTGLGQTGEDAAKAALQLETLRGQVEVAELKIKELSEAGKEGTSTFVSATNKLEQLKAKLELAETSTTKFGGAAQVTTADIREMISAGVIGFDDVSAALGNLTDEGGRFANLMSAQMDTAAGKFSNIKDAFFEVKLAIGKAMLPAINKLADVLLNKLFPAIEPLIPVIGEFFAKTIEALVPIVTENIDRFQKFADILFNELFPAVEPMIPLITEFIGVMLETSMSIYEALVPAFHEIIPLIVDLFTQLKPILPVLGELIVSVIKAGIAFLQILAPALRIIIPILQAIIIPLKYIVEIITEIIDFLADAYRWVRKFLGLKISKSGRDIVRSDDDNVIRLNDFILTPQGKIIKPAKDDTIIGTKGGIGPTFIFHIEKIQGVDPDDMMEAFQRELARKISLS